MTPEKMEFLREDPHCFYITGTRILLMGNEENGIKHVEQGKKKKKKERRQGSHPGKRRKTLL